MASSGGDGPPHNEGWNRVNNYRKKNKSHNHQNNGHPINKLPPNYQERSKSQQYSNNNKHYKERSISQDGESVEIDNEQNRPYPNHYRSRKLGKHALIELSSKEPMDVLQAISNSHCGFEELLNSSPISPDIAVLIMKIICKACSTEFSEFKKRILILACGDSFQRELTKVLTSLALDNSECNKARIKPFSDSIIDFCQTIIELMPNVAIEKLRVLLIVLEMNLKAYMNYLKIDIDQSVFEKIKSMINSLEELAKRKEERENIVKSAESHVPIPTENFRELIVYPQPDDIHLKRPFLHKNIVRGSFSGIEQYLNIQFRLLREDFISPLRNGINEYMGKDFDQTRKKLNSKFDSVRIYKKVRFLKPKTSLNKICYEVCFDVDNKIKNVQWEYTKRFMFGSLLLFSNTNFHNFFLGIVANRELKELQQKRIAVDLVHAEEINISVKELMKHDFEMVESEVYFEPYFNVLNALKNLHSRNFPFERYIIHGNCEPSSPKYIQNNMDVYKINVTNMTNRMPESFTFHLLGDDWPSADRLYLDQSQYNAFKAALTNEFVVIQGPPGTGKTYLGLRIAEALLANKTIWNYPSSPILVVCYTNHALDQFLEGILPLTTNIIRVGGQSKNQNLAPFNLRDRRVSAMHGNMQSPLLRDLRKKLTTMFYTIKTIQGKIEILDKNHGIVSLKTLQYIIPMEFCIGNFNNLDEYLIEWLLEGVEQIRSKQNVKLADCGNIENIIFSKDDDRPIVNEDDFENAERMKNVFLDVMQFDEINSNPGEVEVHYACTKSKIYAKQAEIRNLLEELPNQYLSRAEMQSSMKNTKKVMDDLNSIHAYIDKNLKLSLEGVSKDFLKDLEARKDVWKMPPDHRWILYHFWIHKLKKEFMLEMAKCEENHRKESKQYEEAKQMEDLNIIKGADVVGITTSTAAKLQAIIGQLAPKIVIAEEAAEVLEAHIVASLTNRCEHLILIGDHKQLRPKPAEYRLAKELHLDVSLFERMINNGASSNLLSTQHRMRPEISKLLVPTIYSELRDHKSVQNRKNIKGMEKNLFFLNHNHYEQEVQDMQSKKNIFESKFVVALARHLILQGYKAEEITILATYKGQMFEIKNEWKKYGLSPALRITVVDNFQGEENKIILLSLVRSNKENKIGFLKIENRVCVALSRARDGMYIVGNMDNLVATSLIWPKIKQSLIDQEAYGPALVLRCEIHPKQLTQITCDKDFEQVIEGGCNELCRAPLRCGHLCKSLCHVTNSDHALNKCNEPCKRFCDEGHPCKKRCFETCGGCQEPVTRRLLCDHEVTIPCSIKFESYICKREVKVRFGSCDHTAIIPCGNKGNARCPQPCPFRLDCGHACERSCHVNNDPDHLKYICAKPCSRNRKGCTESHVCKLACFEDCEECTEEVLKTLQCGHQQRAICSKKVDCKGMCKRTLPCGHKCKRKCKDPCEPCVVPVKKLIAECQHEMKMYCHLVASSAYCTGDCKKIMACGHRCNQKCQDLCNQAFCVEPVEVRLNLPCGHNIAKVPCNMRDQALIGGLSSNELLQYCSDPCLTELDCGHICSGTCGKCMQKRIHAVCNEPCGNVLICNHSCPVPCRQVCPPCNKPCPFSCSHSKCPKKCGELCTPCKEPCNNTCPHYKCKKRCSEICTRPPCNHPCTKKFKCDHTCVGFCGEPCPPCKTCCPWDYEEFFYTGEETEEDARFVLLEDCGHTFEVNGLERWLNVQPENNEIVLKSCPKCKTAITKVLRFQSIIKTVLRDIRSVKVKAFGKIEEIRQQRSQLLEKLGQSKFTMSNFPGYSSSADELAKLHKELTRNLPYVKDNRRNEINLGKLGLFHFMVDFVTNIMEKLKNDWSELNGESKSIIFDKVNRLIIVLRSREDKINPSEVEGFSCELKRLHRLVDFMKVKSINDMAAVRNIPSIVTLCERITTILNDLRKYKDEHDNTCIDLLHELQRQIKIHSGITKKDIEVIHNALLGFTRDQYYGGSKRAGHYYKCTCGYIYVVGDCGGQNQIGRCPDCKRQIGGAGRIVATEMH